MVASTELLLKIIKKDVRASGQIVDKGIVTILTPLIMELVEPDAEPERITLIRNTCKIFSELTDLQD